MGSISRVDLFILRLELLNEISNPPIEKLKLLTVDDLLYEYEDGGTLLDCVFYSKGKSKDYKNPPLSLFKIDWEDPDLIDAIVDIIVNDIDNFNVSEEDLFLKYNDKYLLGIILGYIPKDIVPAIIGAIDKNYYMELLDLLVSENRPEFIGYMSDESIELIKNNKDVVFEKYKDKYIVFENLLNILDSEQEKIDICTRFNRKNLLNNVICNMDKDKNYPRKNGKKLERISIDNLSEDDKYLLTVFKELYMNDDNSRYFGLVYDAFRESILSGNETARIMLEKIIEINEKEDRIEIVFDSGGGSCFEPSNSISKVNFSTFAITSSTIFHEFAHVLHYFNNGFKIDYDLSNMIEEIRANPIVFEKRLDKFRKLFLKISTKVSGVSTKLAKEYYKKRIKRYLELEKELIKNIKLNKRNKVSLSTYELLFFEKCKHYLNLDYLARIMENKYPELNSLSDIFDSITAGRLHTYEDFTGHGEEFNQHYAYSLGEIVGDYICIKCLPNGDEMLMLFKEYLGEDLFNVIETASFKSIGISKEKVLKLNNKKRYSN